jgi:hypothetical protein
LNFKYFEIKIQKVELIFIRRDALRVEIRCDLRQQEEEKIEKPSRQVKVLEAKAAGDGISL